LALTFTKIYYSHTGNNLGIAFYLRNFNIAPTDEDVHDPKNGQGKFYAAIMNERPHTKLQKRDLKISTDYLTRKRICFPGGIIERLVFVEIVDFP
jgi:hypothetical protein